MVIHKLITHLTEQGDLPPDPRDDPEFRRWFSGSVVKKGGEPLLVYHATGGGYAEIDPAKSRKGVVFFAERPRNAEFGGKTIKAYLRITNPWVYDGSVVEELSDQEVYGLGWFEKEDMSIHDMRSKVSQELENPNISPWQHRTIIKAIKRAGHDGVYTTDTFGGSTEYGVFNKRQIWQV